jgi:TRAP-type C4-dicarboxylate transport system permease small subunit
MVGFGSIIDLALRVLRWLVFPICLLLFLQWPLREVVRGYSIQANDLGQILFAIYVAASITAATKAGSHLAAPSLFKAWTPRSRRVLLHLCNLLALAPWALFCLASSAPATVSSVLQLERFPETRNPGYFAIKLALWLLALLMLAAVATDLFRTSSRDE